MKAESKKRYKYILVGTVLLIMIILIVVVCFYLKSNESKPNSEYTWKEFEKMTTDEQISFQKSFENSDLFEEWMENAQGLNTVNKFENSDKPLYEYSWKEFEHMSGEDQILFQQSFETTEDFEKWMNEKKTED